MYLYFIRRISLSYIRLVVVNLFLVSSIAANRSFIRTRVRVKAIAEVIAISIGYIRLVIVKK